MRTTRLFIAMPAAVWLPAVAVAHQTESSSIAHFAAHAVWLLPILLIGVAPLLLRRQG